MQGFGGFVLGLIIGGLGVFTAMVLTGWKKVA